MRRLPSVLLPVLAFLGLALPLAAHWSAPGDEGVTLDQALGPIALDGATTLPFEEVAAVLAHERGYGVADVVAAMRTRGMHPPAYPVLVNLWSRAFGTGRAGLRSLGLVLGVLSVVAVWGAARRLAPAGPAATWAALLLAVSLNQVYYAVQLRPYALVLALVGGSLWLMLLLREPAPPRVQALRWAGFVALGVLGLYTLYHYAFFLAWELGVLLLWALWAPLASRRREVGRVVAAAALIALCFAPWLGALAHHLELTAAGDFYFQGFPPARAWPAGAALLVRQLILGNEFPRLGTAAPLAVLALLTAALLGPALLAAGPPERRRERRILWLAVPLLPVAVFLTDALRDAHTAFLVKTMLPLLPFSLLALAVGAQAFPRRSVGVLCLGFWLAVLCAGSAARVLHAVHTPSWETRAAEQLRARDRDDHLVIVSSDSRRFLYPLLLRMRDLGTLRSELTVAGTDELDAVLARLIESGAFGTISLVSFGDGEGWYEGAHRRSQALMRRHRWQRLPGDVPRVVSFERTHLAR